MRYISDAWPLSDFAVRDIEILFGWLCVCTTGDWTVNTSRSIHHKYVTLGVWWVADWTSLTGMCPNSWHMHAPLPTDLLVKSANLQSSELHPWH